MAKAKCAGGKSGLDELVLAGSAHPQRRKPRKDGWSQAKEREFLSVLAETCNVRLAAGEAGVSTATVYKRRKEDAAFRGAWLEAVGAAYQRLEMVLLERAFVGTEKIVRRKDGSEERMVEYPNQLALTLLRMHRESAIEADREFAPEDVDEIRERLINKLQRLKARDGGEDAAGE